MILGNILVKNRTEKSKYNNAARSYSFAIETEMCLH